MKDIECTTAKLTLWHWMVKMCQCSFIICNKCPLLVGDVGHGEACACVVAGVIWEISVPPAPCCCKSKTTLKM